MLLFLDLRHSLRSVIKAPGFLIASTLSLALGVDHMMQRLAHSVDVCRQQAARL